jgi:hypothetical protein
MWELALFIIHIIRDLVEERDKRTKAASPPQSLPPAPMTRQPDAQPRTAAVTQAPTPRQKVALGLFLRARPRIPGRSRRSRAASLGIFHTEVIASFPPTFP